MSRSVVGEGKTIDDAINSALAILNASRTEVDIEIIQEPTKKVFGLKKEPAIVRVSLKSKPAPKQRDTATVGVVGGELVFQPAKNGNGEPPIIVFGSELDVYYNGEKVEKELELAEGIEPLEVIIPEAQEPALDYRVVVNGDKTRAELIWQRKPGVEYTLEDFPPTHRLPLRLKKVTTEPPMLTLKDVADILMIEGIKFGLQLDSLTEEQFEAVTGAVTVAIGQEPIPPEQPSINCVFQTEAPDIDPDALRIDYFEVYGISGVKPGDVLAVKNHGRPGKPGIDVYGEPISTEPLRQIEIKVGEGVALADDGSHAVATTSGLPTLQGDVIRVTSVFELKGDADASTGNITVDGNIIIHGNVLDSIKVESDSGNIVVNGLISGAVLRAGGSITVIKNVIRSQIIAGGSTVVRISFRKMLSRIAAEMEQLIAAYESIVSQAAHIPFENLIKHLLELKFFQLPKDIKLFTDYVKEHKGECTEELAQLAETLGGSFLGFGPPKVLDIDHLKAIFARTQAQVAVLEAMSLTESDVSVGYLQNSRIEASGHVKVTGKGCFYSDILAGKGFSIANGVFRGGEVTIGSGRVEARELGGPTGIATLAQIVEDGEIVVNLVHPNVTIAIKDQSYRFPDNASQVRAYLENGLLQVFSGSLKIHG